ncbi:GH92 family glycosyl hydrolase [Parapedobacter defluvii]|uniref:GH92 family glycosyl hydrolase n=1 Tax=Parapedobacter defluvii TaxID=2045106 RepID=UPI003341EDB2
MKRYVITTLCLMLAGQLMAGPDNIAPSAKVTASSVNGPKASEQGLIDGLIGIENKGEWSSQSTLTSWGAIDYPWVQLDWNQPQRINRIVLYDRATRDSHTAGGTLYFSDGSSLAVSAIPNDGRAKTIDFPEKEVVWVRFEVTDGDGLQLGLSEMEVYPTAGNTVDFVSKVDPYIESARGRYFFFVTGNQPFGMIGAAPLTRNKNQYGGGYNYNSLEVLGFPQVHGWMLSGITLMPTTGTVDPRKGEQYWKSKFSHDGEIVQPAYHRLFLEDYGIWVEQTATERVSFYRLRYTKNTASDILLNLGGYLGETTMTDADVRRVSDTELEGSVISTGRFWGGPDKVKIFFVMKFDKPFHTLDGWNGSETYSQVTRLKGSSEVHPKNAGESYVDAPTAGVSARYAVAAGEQIQVKFAISYTSVENARNNLNAECDHWDFDAVRAQSRAVWNEYLGRIDVKGGTEAQRVKFYTDLWHVLMGRHKIDDVSGDYPDYTQGDREGRFTKNARLIVRTLPKNPDGSVRFHMYNSDAFWLTQWNLNVLWGLAWPEVLDDFAASLIQYAKNGGLLPRGPNVGGYSFIMTSCPATNLITSAYQKGMLTKMDPADAYLAMVENHKPGGMLGPKEEIAFYIKNGYYPGNAGITIEAAFQDWALSQMAEKMGKGKDAVYYAKRSMGWKKLFRPDQQLIFPKDADGRWLHADPLSGQGWIEANAWQATWGLSHAIPELAQLMGGNDAFCKKLNHAFEQSAKDDFVFGYSNGYVSYANQPGCSNAHVFSHAGQPWLTQYWVRRVKEQAYGAITPDKGYGGHDEDQGQMGGVSALMAIGLFNIQGNSGIDPRYDLTSPIFDEVTIKLHPDYYQGTAFKIKVNNNSKDNCYIQRTALNGTNFSHFQLSHSDFARGGELEMWLGPTPNKNWGIQKQ